MCPRGRSGPAFARFSREPVRLRHNSGFRVSGPSCLTSVYVGSDQAGPHALRNSLGQSSILATILRRGLQVARVSLFFADRRLFNELQP